MFYCRQEIGCYNFIVSLNIQNFKGLFSILAASIKKKKKKELKRFSVVTTCQLKTGVVATRDTSYIISIHQPVGNIWSNINDV